MGSCNRIPQSADSPFCQHKKDFRRFCRVNDEFRGGATESGKWRKRHFWLITYITKFPVFTCTVDLSKVC